MSALFRGVHETTEDISYIMIFKYYYTLSKLWELMTMLLHNTNFLWHNCGESSSRNVLYVRLFSKIGKEVINKQKSPSSIGDDMHIKVSCITLTMLYCNNIAD